MVQHNGSTSWKQAVKDRDICVKLMAGMGVLGSVTTAHLRDPNTCETLKKWGVTSGLPGGDAKQVMQVVAAANQSNDG